VMVGLTEVAAAAMHVNNRRVTTTHQAAPPLRTFSACHSALASAMDPA
jgi:hypothetical protein